jgi:hypothetical protein
MKFRFVLLNPDDDPSPSTPPPECDDGLLRNTSELMRYERRGAGMARIEPLENGRTRVTPVANFQARIVSDLMVDDGDQEQRAFSLEAEVAGQRIAFSVSAVEFAGMGWVLKRLGPQAIVYPGQQQHARAAIQWLSGPIPQERIFAHLGWRKHGRHWVYLHAGGALSGDGPLPGVQVQLPAALQSYHLLPGSRGWRAPTPNPAQADRKQHPERGLPRPRLATEFEVVIDGKVYRVEGRVLQRWITQRRQEWNGPRGHLFNSAALMPSAFLKGSQL